MSAAVDALKTVEDCDYLLKWIALAKKSATADKLHDEVGEEKISGSSTDIDSEIVELNIKLASLATTIAALPDGDYKSDKLLEQSATNTRLLSLQKRKRSMGAPARVLKEMEVAIGGFELQVYTDKETDILARRAQIAG